MRFLIPVLIVSTLVSGCGSSPVSSGPIEPSVSAARSDVSSDALQVDATANRPTYGKVMQFAWTGWDARHSVDGQMLTCTLSYRVWLQAGPDRLGTVFTKQEIVERDLIMELREAGSGKWAPDSVAVKTNGSGFLTIVRNGKPVVGVAPGLKSVDTELQAMLALIEKNKLYPETPRGDQRMSILWFIETFRPFITKG